jgi:hypothetical protein
MKKVYLFFMLCFFFSTCGQDKNPLIVGDANDFAMYLMADTSIRASKLYQADLDTLVLSHRPLFNLDGLKYYKWGNHTFSVSANILSEIGRIVKNRRSTGGIPFVIVVQDSRRYLGAFWFGFSSMAPVFPYIPADEFLFGTVSDLTIEKAWNTSDLLDVRNDSLIYNALMKAHKLVE